MVVGLGAFLGRFSAPGTLDECLGVRGWSASRRCRCSTEAGVSLWRLGTLAARPTQASGRVCRGRLRSRRKRERRRTVGERAESPGRIGPELLRARHLRVRPDNPCGAHAPLSRALARNVSMDVRWVVRRNHLHRSIEKPGVRKCRGRSSRATRRPSTGCRAADYGTSDATMPRSSPSRAGSPTAHGCSCQGSCRISRRHWRELQRDHGRVADPIGVAPR